MKHLFPQTCIYKRIQRDIRETFLHLLKDNVKHIRTAFYQCIDSGELQPFGDLKQCPEDDGKIYSTN
jgi:hypothetical protein